MKGQDCKQSVAQEREKLANGYFSYTFWISNTTLIVESRTRAQPSANEIVILTMMLIK